MGPGAVSKQKPFSRKILQNFILPLISLLIVLIFKNSHILGEIYSIVLKICPIPNLKGFQYQICTSVKASKIKAGFSNILQTSCYNFKLKLCYSPQKLPKLLKKLSLNGSLKS